MRVLVCGGRDFNDSGFVMTELDHLNSEHRFTMVIHGAAPGADSLADIWAQSRHIKQTPFPADWKAHGRAAGPLRNRQMLTEGRPDLVVAFPGGRGTAHMVKLAQEANVPVIEVKE